MFLRSARYTVPASPLNQYDAEVDVLATFSSGFKVVGKGTDPNGVPVYLLNEICSALDRLANQALACP